MMGVRSEKLLRYIQDYRIHLIDPAKITEEDLLKFTSSLRKVIEYIKYSKDKDNLAKILKDNPRMVIDREAALVIKTITKTTIEISEKEEKIDMCKAIDDMLNESKAEGKAEGRLGMLTQLVREGNLKVERAAVKARMTVEQFKKVMSDNK